MMGESIFKRIVLPAVTIIAGFAAIYPLSGMIERSRPPLPDGFSDSDLSMNGSRLKGFALGMEGLIADWYYIRSLQYIGDKIVAYKGDINIENLRELNPRLLHPLLDNATDLDPHFVAAYSYGGIVLPAIDREQALSLANKGIVNNPEQWRLYQNLGYIYWRIGDYEKAAETFEKGSAIKDASTFMKLMSAAMKTEGGSRETARAIYTEMLANSNDEQVRITAKRRLDGLDSLDERDAIDKILADFKEKNGRCVGSLFEINSMLLNVRLPTGREFRVDNANRLVDPTDIPYLLDKENCRVKLDAGRTGLPVK